MATIRGLIHVAGIVLGGLFIFASGTGPVFERSFTLFDDAMISMTYARTLADTGVWNWYPGAEDVQGFTNLGWTLWMSILHLFPLSGSSISLVVSLSSLFAIFGTAVMAGKIASFNFGEGSKSKYAPLIASSLVYLSFPLMFWSLRGMEVGLLAFLTVLILWLYLRARSSRHLAKGLLVPIGLISLVGTWVRMDFAVVPMTIALVSFVFFWKERARSSLWITTTLLVASMAGVATVMIFQFLTWGDFLPNTFYLKATGVSLAERLPRGLLATLKIAPIATLTILLVSNLVKRFKGTMIAEVLAVVASISMALAGYSIYVGGDAWEDYLFANRYITPALPLVAIVLGLYADRATYLSKGAKLLILTALTFTSMGMSVTTNEPFTWWVALFAASSVLMLALAWIISTSGSGAAKKITPNRAIAVSLALFFALTVSGVGLGSTFKWGGIQASAVDAQMARWGLEIRDLTKEDAMVAVVWAGAPVYYSDRAAVDLLGKNDRRIAKMDPPEREPGTWNEKFVPGHNKWDFDWSIVTLKPDLIFQYIELAGEEAKLRTLGYEEFCLSDGYKVQVQKNSLAIYREKLQTCTSIVPKT